MCNFLEKANAFGKTILDKKSHRCFFQTNILYKQDLFWVLQSHKENLAIITV